MNRRGAVLGAAATITGVLAVVAAGAALTGGGRDTDHSPARPAPSATGTAVPGATPDAGPDAAATVRDGRLVDYAVTSKGALLTVWQRCTKHGGRCATAWQLQGRAGIEQGLVRGRFAGADAAGDHVVLMSWNRTGVVLDDDGRSRPLRPVAARTVTAGDALVRLPKTLAVVDPVAAEFWPLPAPDGVDGWVEGAIAADGSVWATPWGPAPPIDVRISWLAHGATARGWQHHTFSTSFAGGVAPGPIAVAGDHVAVPAMHDGVDVATFGTFAVTTDAGASWSDLGPSDLPFDNVDAMAATSGGTLYVASTDRAGRERLFRSSDGTWTRFALVPHAPEVHQLVPAGDRVVARGGTLDRTEIFTLDDAGHATPWAILP